MNKAFLLGGLFLTSISSSLCLSCNKVYVINFECNHCTYAGEKVIYSGNEYNASFNIDFGWQLTTKDIEVYNNDVLDNDCWTFMYQSNVINSFKIKPNTVKGNIKVKVNCSPKELFKYGLAVDVPEVNQSSIRFYPIQKEIKYIEDWQRDAFQIFEDEKLEFTFSSNDGETLPTNIGMWMNGRYAKENEEVTFTYSSDKKSCKVDVPYFVTKDNLQFRVK